MSKDKLIDTVWVNPTTTVSIYIKGKLEKTMSRVAEDKHGRYLPARLIGAILQKRGKQ